MPRRNVGRTLGSERALAARLAYEREKRGWTYESIANRMEAEGCPIQLTALHKIEKGDPPRRVTLDEALALARVFDLDLEEFILPLELVEQRRGRELARSLLATHEELGAKARHLLKLNLELFVIAQQDQELLEYVYSHIAFGGGLVLPPWRPEDLGSGLTQDDADRVQARMIDLLRTSAEVASETARRGLERGA